MVNRQIDAMAELQNSFQVLFKNWVLALPTAVASLVAGAFMVFFFAATMASLIGAGAVGGMHPGLGALLGGAGGLTALLGIAIVVLLMLLAQAVVMGGAERVWHGQPADLAQGVSKALGKLPALVVLFILAAIVFGICAVLIVIGWIIALILAFLYMYTVPAIVVGNEGVGAALGTSYRLVRANMNASLMAFLGIVVVSLVGGLISNLFLHFAILGLVIQFVVGGITAAFAALVVVRFYDLLRGAAA